MTGISAARYSVNLTPPVVSFELYRGDDASFTATIRNPPVSPSTVGTPVDLTGSTVSFSLVARDGSSVVVPATITTPLAGLVTVALTGAVTANLAPGEYRGRLRWTDADGKPRTPVATLHRVR